MDKSPSAPKDMMTAPPPPSTNQQRGFLSRLSLDSAASHDARRGSLDSTGTGTPTMLSGSYDERSSSLPDGSFMSKFMAGRRDQHAKPHKLWVAPTATDDAALSSVFSA